MATSQFIIYGLQDPETFEIRYIGKSKKGLKRPKSHLLPCIYNDKKNEKYPIYRWIRKLLTKNLNPIILIIQEFEYEFVLNDAEKYWIKYFKELKSPLLNLTDGGDGVVGYIYTNEHGEKISKIHNGAKRSEQAKENLKNAIIESRKSMDMVSFKKKVSAGAKIWWNNLDNNIQNKIITENLNYAGKNKIKIQDQYGNIYESLTEAAKKLKSDSSAISQAMKKNRPCKGFIFTKVVK